MEKKGVKMVAMETDTEANQYCSNKPNTADGRWVPTKVRGLLKEPQPS